MNKIFLAKVVSESLHCDKSYDEFDYIKHCEDVIAVLKEFGTDDEDMIVSAYLHDTVEDTQMKLGLIRKYFGMNVYNLVYAVTNELGENRTQRNLKTYTKLRENQDAVRLKLADRIANVRHAIHKRNRGIMQMYKLEYSGFKTFLNDNEHNQDMWMELDKIISD